MTGDLKPLCEADLYSSLRYASKSCIESGCDDDECALEHADHFMAKAIVEAVAAKLALTTVFVVTWPGEDLEAFSTAALAAQHVRDCCSVWPEDTIDFRGLDKVVSGDSMICTVECPDGDVGVEQCEVREEVA